ncbi:MAG: hypothetical protein ABI778_08370 [Ignavibacteriota bacterium]
MKKLSTIAFFLLGVLIACPLLAQEKHETFAITNYVSDRYRDLQMMKISIVPPQGFVRDTDQIGFIDSKNASAIRAEEIQKGIEVACSGFLNLFDSTGKSDSLGLRLLDKFDFAINGFKAHLVSLSGKLESENYDEWWLFIGDKTETYILKGFLPHNKKAELEQAIRSSLLSVFYEPDRRLIPPGGDPTITGSSSCNCHNKN